MSYLVDIKVFNDGIKASVEIVQKIHYLERDEMVHIILIADFSIHIYSSSPERNNIMSSLFVYSLILFVCYFKRLMHHSPTNYLLEGGRIQPREL